MKGVLVTGATTHVGTALVRRLLASERIERVVAVGREAPETSFGFAADPRVSYHPLDLTRVRNLRNFLFGEVRAQEVEAVVHCAFHRRARDEGAAVRRLNVELTRNLVRLSERHPRIQRFVYRSHADVYRVGANLPDVIREDSPLAIDRSSPQVVRDRVEADVAVNALVGSPDLQVAVLRCAECFAPGSGSQLYDYLDDWLCLRPLGFDPMINLLSVEDLARALELALFSNAQGVFNIPGADTLPLSAAIRERGRLGWSVPGPVLRPLYALRAAVKGTDFRYDMNRRRFHFSGVLEGTRARTVLGFEPTHRLEGFRVSASHRRTLRIGRSRSGQAQRGP